MMQMIPTGTKSVSLLGPLGAETGMQSAFRVLGLLSGAALAFHGYKRNRSVGWALVWGLVGGAFWPIAVPISLAQGFGKRK